MCETCGCQVTIGNEHLIRPNGPLEFAANGSTTVEVLQSLLSENDQTAAHNRHHFDSHRVLVINLMSSPGSGKTALLESTIEALQGKYRMAVIEGDLETENDALRIRAKGIPAIQIVTGTACHLDAHMIHKAIHQLSLSELDILFIENVGNLVCPASFDLGHHCNVTLLSVTEGDDKPLKYPVMFRSTDLMLLSKSDLLPVLDDFDPIKAEQNLRQLANASDVITVSAKTRDGIPGWLDWLERRIQEYRQSFSLSESREPELSPTL